MRRLRARIGVAKARYSAGRDFGDDEGGVVPVERAVGFGRVGRDAKGARGDALDDRSRLGHAFPPQTSSRTTLAAIVLAISPAAGVPRASDSARWRASLKLTFGGIGGSF